MSPLARSPQNPLLLAALGTTVFSGGLAASSALGRTRQAEEEDEDYYFPILVEGTSAGLAGVEEEQVSIRISSQSEVRPATGEVGSKDEGSLESPVGGVDGKKKPSKQHLHKYETPKRPGGGHTRPNGGHKQPNGGHKRPNVGHKKPNKGHKRPKGGHNWPNEDHKSLNLEKIKCRKCMIEKGPEGEKQRNPESNHTSHNHNENKNKRPIKLHKTKNKNKHLNNKKKLKGGKKQNNKGKTQSNQHLHKPSHLKGQRKTKGQIKMKTNTSTRDIVDSNVQSNDKTENSYENEIEINSLGHHNSTDDLVTSIANAISESFESHKNHLFGSRISDLLAVIENSSKEKIEIPHRHRPDLSPQSRKVSAGDHLSMSFGD